MKYRILPYAQAGLEGARWLRNEAEIGGTVGSHLRSGSLREAGLVAVKNALLLLPTFDVKEPLKALVDDKFDVVGAGSEAIVTRSNTGNVRKYITGKSEEVGTLAPKLQQLDTRARKYLEDYLPPTSVNRETVKLFKGMPAREYVRLDQPLVNIKFADPHKNTELLDDHPEIATALRDFSLQLMDLFEHEGLLMDIVNAGNLVWGNIDKGKDQLYLLDTVPVDYGESDFTGIRVPFWSPGMHLEYLADFVDTVHMGSFFTEELAANWLEDSR